MSGTVKGGRKAALTNKQRYGDDFYKVQGRKGGKTPSSKPRGFAANPELAKRAGKIGGTISRRKPRKTV